MAKLFTIIYGLIGFMAMTWQAPPMVAALGWFTAAGLCVYDQVRGKKL